MLPLTGAIDGPSALCYSPRIGEGTMQRTLVSHKHSRFDTGFPRNNIARGRPEADLHPPRIQIA